MEIGEDAAFDMFEATINADKYCNKEKPEKKNWRARVNQWGTDQKCSGTRLYDTMEATKKKGADFLGPPTPFVAKPAGTGFKWDLDKIDTDHFPIQAHHIIPKNHLPTHAVCTFLAKGYTQNPKFQLVDDTEYSCDHQNNGYCMPYATPLAEWKRARSSGDDDIKLAIAFCVMEETGRQLHQGSHRAEAYDSVDDDEEANIHPGGYLDRIDQFLDVVQAGAEKHVTTCRVCKTDEAKKEIEPIAAVVTHMDMVSGIIKLLIDGNRIFISEPAHLWWSDKQNPMERPAWLKRRR
jgi:hypothetical protein